MRKLIALIATAILLAACEPENIQTAFSSSEPAPKEEVNTKADVPADAVPGIEDGVSR